MITRTKVLENINDAIFEAITTACCMEEDSCGKIYETSQKWRVS